MVKIAICDDETEFLDLLSDSLDSWCRAHQLTLQLYRFTNGDELISAHRAYGMDLILLDMIMPAWIPHANCASMTRTFRSFF